MAVLSALLFLIFLREVQVALGPSLLGAVERGVLRLLPFNRSPVHPVLLKGVYTRSVFKPDRPNLIKIRINPNIILSSPI